MLELSKEQRLQVYKATLAWFIMDKEKNYDCYNSEIEFGMCAVLLFNTPGHRLNDPEFPLIMGGELDEIPLMYPEFWKRKPKKTCGQEEDHPLWFLCRDFDSRISLLKECINELS